MASLRLHEHWAYIDMQKSYGTCPQGNCYLLEGDWDKSNQTTGTASAKALGWMEHARGKEGAFKT